ncbi:MAG: hypothetical protein H7X86_13690 [Gorillibacterium sp.]|nr:hypothetical protein [Gorillibacterium sp.]
MGCIFGCTRSVKPQKWAIVLSFAMFFFLFTGWWGTPQAKAEATVVTYTNFPAGTPDGTEFTHVSINGQNTFVYKTQAEELASFSAEGQVSITVTHRLPVESVVIRPLNRAVTPVVH